MRLNDKVAFISGSTRGIGRTTPRCSPPRAPRSWCRAVRSTRARRSHPGSEKRAARPRSFDSTSATSRACEEAIATTIDGYGTLTTLINNAAPTDLVSAGFKPMHEVTTDEWDAIVRATLTGNVFWASKYAIPHLIEAGGGSIVNVSSGGSTFGVPGNLGYSASKGGMNALTRTMAVEYAPYGIRCNTIIVGRVVSYAQDRGPDTTRELSRVGKPSRHRLHRDVARRRRVRVDHRFRDRRRRRVDDQPLSTLTRRRFPA